MPGRDRVGVATATTAAKTTANPKIHRSNATSHEQASAPHPVAPERRATRPQQKRYRATSPGQPAGRSHWTDPVRHPSAPRCCHRSARASTPDMEAQQTTSRNSLHGDGCPEAIAVHAPRPKPSRMSHADHGAGARSPTCSVDSGRSHRRRRAPTSRRVPGHHKRRALTGRSQLEPCTDDFRTGCPVTVGRSALRGRSRKGRHTRRLPNGVPGRHHAPPQPAEAEKDVTRQHPNGARSSPRSTLRSRS